MGPFLFARAASDILRCRYCAAFPLPFNRRVTPDLSPSHRNRHAIPMTQHPRRPRRSRQAKPVADPQADPAFAHIAAPEIRHRVRLARIAHGVRRVNQQYIGEPLGDLMLHVWLKGLPGAGLVEEKGLPRHNLTRWLGPDALTLHVNPRELIQFAETAPYKHITRPPSVAFIWDGDWDLRRTDLRQDPWIAYMRDLDENRHNLENSQRFHVLMERLKAGNPFRSHQEGVFLNSRQRILDYLAVYLGFLDNMATNGYDETRAKDMLGVVISREGRILKINRGLHRLAMAQYVGLPTIPVQVRHVHRTWWQSVTHGTTGAHALQRLRDALPHCRPEQHSGPLTEHPPVDVGPDFWPIPRYHAGKKSP